MKIAFRVDASQWIGVGHLMRCLTLADALRERGAEIIFISRDHPGSMLHLVRERAYPLVTLARVTASPPARSDDYAAWLGVSQSVDATETQQAMQTVWGREAVNWIVVDHYGISREWHQKLRPSLRIAVIDDLAERLHDCDLLIDHNFAAHPRERYAGKIPPNCRILAGPEYALLRPEYRQHRQTLRERTGTIRRVLVSFGGADGVNMTGRVLDALSTDPALQALEVDLVIGANHPEKASLEQRAQQRPHTHVYGHREHLADLMATADLAIGAGGSTTWERMCLGLPTLIMSIAENQIPACKALAGAHLVASAGHYPDITAATLAGQIRALMESPSHAKKLSSTNMALVDGLGAERVAEALLPSSASEWRVCARAGNPAATTFALRSFALEWGRLSYSRNPAKTDSPFTAELTVDPIARDQMASVSAALFAQSRVDLFRIHGPHYVRRLGEPALPQSPTLPLHSIALISDAGSWINAPLAHWYTELLDAGHSVLWVHDPKDLRPGDVAFYLSLGQLVDARTRAQFKHNLVVHESALPEGKGWSPLTWQVLEGKSQIPVTLFEAAEKVDSGVIYAQTEMKLTGHELIDDLRAQQAAATFELGRTFLKNFPGIVKNARPQSGTETFYVRRTARDSALDPQQSLVEQFNLLRVVDNDRYPAYFDHLGHRYRLSIAHEGKAST